MLYGKKLREARKARGFTLIKVSLELNTSFETISRYENEKREPNLEMLKKLCVLYNVSADYIIGITDNKKINRSKDDE